MSAKIIDLALTERLPQSVDCAGYDRLLITVWRQTTPVATVEIAAAGRLISAPELREALVLTCGEDLFDDCSHALTSNDSTSRSTTSISVVICTRDRADQLPVCLDALALQNGIEFETLVVDNAPTDAATRDLVHERYPQCRYVVEPIQGIGFARNRAIAESGGEIIAFLDDDCRPTPGWLPAIVTNFAKRPGLGCCTGPVLPFELKTRAQVLMETRGGFNKGFVKQVFTHESGKNQWKSYPLQTWMCGTGGNMAFRRSIFDAIGLFDENSRVVEDLEMFFRVLRGRFELVYEPAAVVRHRHVSDYPALRRRLYRWGLGYIAYLAKVARTDPAYRRQARAEIVAWFYPYQLRDRLWRRLVRQVVIDFPLSLIVAEIVGGASALSDHGRFRRRARRPTQVWR